MICCVGSGGAIWTPAMQGSPSVLRLVFPMPTWEDYLTLAFDEIRQYGADSVQVMRRLRSALMDLAGSVVADTRAEAVRRYLKHLDAGIGRSSLDADDQEKAREEDRQGLGLSRRRVENSIALISIVKPTNS